MKKIYDEIIAEAMQIIKKLNEGGSYDAVCDICKYIADKYGSPKGTGYSANGTYHKFDSKEISSGQAAFNNYQENMYGDKPDKMDELKKLLQEVL